MAGSVGEMAFASWVGLALVSVGAPSGVVVVCWGEPVWAAAHAVGGAGGAGAGVGSVGVVWVSVVSV